MTSPREWPGVRLGLAVQRRYGADSAGFLAAAVTYYAFLSLFPLLLLGLALLGFFLAGDPAGQAEWARKLADAVPGLGSLIGDGLRSIVAGRAAVGVVGLLGLGWAGRGVVKAASHAVGTVFRRTQKLRFPLGELWALGVLAALGSLALASLVISGAVAGLAGDSALVGVGAATLGFALDVVLFLLAYRLLTSGRGPRFRELWPGAALAATGWTILKLVGSWYAARTASGAEAVYGVFGTVVGMLVLLYLGSQLLLYGAELNAVLMERKARDEREHARPRAA